MERVPEPELMDEAEQAIAYAEADFAEPHQAFVEHFRRCFPDFASGTVLDLGCGPADVTVRFACAYPSAQVIGVDGAEAMLAAGRERLRREALEGRVSLLNKRLPASLGSGYEAVISNSLLHHLADPMVLWQAVLQSAAPAAPVLVMDLLRPRTMAEAEQLTTCYAGEAPAVLRKDFFNSLLAAYRLDEIERQLRVTGLERLRVERVSDRHVIVWGRV